MADNPQEYDLVVIGGGPAGMVGATTAAAFEKTVAVVDNHPELGGAGANTGTVPSKTLRETALAFSGMRSRNLYGVDLSLRREATVTDFLRHQRNVKAGLNHLLSQRMETAHVTVHCGAVTGMAGTTELPVMASTQTNAPRIRRSTDSFTRHSRSVG